MDLLIGENGTQTESTATGKVLFGQVLWQGVHGDTTDWLRVK